MGWWDAALGPVTPSEDLGALGPVSSRRRAREWSLVLQSQAIDSSLELRPVGWIVRVAEPDQGRAKAVIDEYEAENADWPPKRVRDVPRHAPSGVIPLAFAALALFFAFVTGPAHEGSAWFRLGTADARLLWSEPWRMVTALTLHADGKHVLGNLISGGIFGAAVSRRLGAGGGLLAIVVAGFVGNAANALYHQADGHRSIGASTAVFAAVGLLAALQVWADRSTPSSRMNRVLTVLGPVIGGLALLGSLGASPQSDLWAHLYGFIAGVAIGLAVGFVQRRRAQPVQRVWPQLLLGAAGLGIVLGSWQLALRLG
jgi:membrane associated rhomboid family serine protease